MYNNCMSQDQSSTPVAAILDAATRCYLRAGIENTGMREVAQAAGVARSTLYRYFATRDEVLVSAIHREMLAMAEDMRKRLQRFPDGTCPRYPEDRARWRG